MRLFPPITFRGQFASPEVAASAHNPVTYHAGGVMAGGITVHTVFWGPHGSFPGSPRRGVPSYEGLIEQFFTDVAHDSGRRSNAFSTLIQ